MCYIIYQDDELSDEEVAGAAVEEVVEEEHSIDADAGADDEMGEHTTESEATAGGPSFRFRRSHVVAPPPAPSRLEDKIVIRQTSG